MNTSRLTYLHFLIPKFWRNIGLQTLEWLAYSNIYTGVCAMSLVAMSYTFLKIPLASIDFLDFGIVGIFTTLGYQFPYTIASKPVFATPQRTEWFRNHRPAMQVVIAIELVIFVILLFYISIYKILILCIAALIGLGYYGILSYPFAHKKWEWRHYSFGKIGSICTVWLLLSIALPLLDFLPVIAVDKLLILCFTRLLLMAALCLIFDIRDIATDLAQNLHTLAAKLGLNLSRRLTIVLTILYFIASICFLKDLQFAPLHLLIFLWICKIAQWQKQPRSELHYLLLVDGTMFIPYLIFIIIHSF